MNSGNEIFVGLRIKEHLASHAHNESYLVTERGRGRRSSRVLKLLPGTAGPLREWLREDMPQLASLSHAALALPTVFGTSGATGRPCLIRDFIDGDDFLAATRRCRGRKIISWWIAAAEALGILHRFGHLHRNLHAANLIAQWRTPRRQGKPKVVLCDAAWWPEEEEAQFGGSITRLRPAAAVEPPSFGRDLFALGAIFYQSLTGSEVAFDRDGFALPPKAGDAGLPGDFARVLTKLLHPEASRRYQDANALLGDLHRLQGSSATPLPVPECFLGRRSELVKAVEHLERQGGPVAVAVGGEGGIGKSAFLRRLAHEAQIHGFRTISFRCFVETTGPLTSLRALLERILPHGPPGRSLRARLRRLLRDVQPTLDDRIFEAGKRDPIARGFTDLVVAASRGTPTVVFIDDVHLAGAHMLALLDGLVREIAVRAPIGRGPPSVVVSFRNESPFRGATRPIRDAIATLREDSLFLDLAPLPEETVETWLDLALPDALEARESIASGTSPKGHPFSIREAIHLGTGRVPRRQPFSADVATVLNDFAGTLTAEERSVLEVLAVLGRPASGELLAAAARVAAADLRAALDSLEKEGVVREEGARFFFQHDSFRTWLVEHLEEERRRQVHGHLAAYLHDHDPAAIEEEAHHWLRSDTPEVGIATALDAARRLAMGRDESRAIELYERVLELLPADSELRPTACEECAEAYARISRYRRAVEMLQPLVDAGADTLEAGRLHGRLGVFWHRAGEIGQAEFHLQKGLALLEGANEPMRLTEELTLQTELAEIASNRGDYDEAEHICKRALSEIAAHEGARDRARIRHAEMVLLETLAHLELRRFHYDRAERLFEKSLAISQDIDTPSEKSLILNNLGILYNQRNRFRQAIECYQQALRETERLGGDSNLVNLHSNLALLFAKTGQPDEADAAIRKAALHDARADSHRTRFLRLHCAGVVDLLLGRYGSAIDTLKAATVLGEELKDRFLTAFDLVYVSESHLFRGETRAAQLALERAQTVDPCAPLPIRSMVLSRRAVLAALGGDRAEAKSCTTLYDTLEAHGIEYLEAWNSLFLGWAHRLTAERERSARELRRALDFFSAAKVPVGEIHARLELAALAADAGKLQKADRLLQAVRNRHTCGRGPLKNPQLAARLLAYQARVLLDADERDVQKVSLLLVEAEGYLIGRTMGDLDSMVRNLRRRVGVASLSARRVPFLAADPERGSSTAIELARHLRGAAAELVRKFQAELGEPRTAALERSIRDFDEHLQQLQRQHEGLNEQSLRDYRASSILGTSPVIESVKTLIRQVAAASIPVLVLGDTGTGKELVARAIHGESPRRSEPFTTISCAAIPEPLLEAELFGYRRGAFSGAERDHDGLLVATGGGTILLDEISELPVTLQAKLLRVLDSRQVRPLGDAEERSVDARFLFATNQDLSESVEDGTFRSDLYYRIKTFEIRVPPLSERLEDLPLLVEHFRRQVAESGEAAMFDSSALRALAGYSWPGNVRELHNVVTQLAFKHVRNVGDKEVRAVLRQTGAESLFPPAFLRSRPLKLLSAQLEKEYLCQLYADTEGNVRSMADALGITVQGLYKRLKMLGLRPRDLRGR